MKVKEDKGKGMCRHLPSHGGHWQATHKYRLKKIKHRLKLQMCDHPHEFTNLLSIHIAIYFLYIFNIFPMHKDSVLRQDLPTYKCILVCNWQFLPQSSKCCDCSCVPPCLAQKVFYLFKVFFFLKNYIFLVLGIHCVIYKSSYNIS
jgi:hypothetical protein